jgi:transcriptional regulator with XRE-family HTH domain
MQHDGELPATPGGTLYALRKRRKLSNLDLAERARVSPTTLSRLENDHIDHPERQTLDRVLSALNQVKAVSLAERRSVLAAFGYKEDDALPSALDICRAVASWAEPFKAAPFPAYLADCAQRIHDWNGLVLRLLGVADRGMLPPKFTVFDLAFNPAYQGGMTVPNRREFIPEMVRVMKSEFLPFRGRDWCRECVSQARRRYREFDEVWGSIPDADLGAMSIRSMGPLVLRHPSGSVLRFQIVDTDLVSDRRFQAVQYTPPDAETSATCFALMSVA